jgi:hypothetical protein
MHAAAHLKSSSMSRSTFSNSASTNLAARRSLRLFLVTPWPQQQQQQQELGVGSWDVNIPADGKIVKFKRKEHAAYASSLQACALHTTHCTRQQCLQIRLA